ncbi:MAG TPA: YraN family protein [Steroidobacteraceae bacterium]|nr:YraN family protein [Steroidobacteraceae bacterium]
MARPNSSTRCAESRRTDAQRLGCEAEQAAARHLEAHALRVVLRNYRCRLGELDLVALAPDGTLVIAEVRMRSRQNYGGGAASVTCHKQRRLLRATRHLLAMQPQWSRHALRFDVLDLRPATGGYDIRWIQHAFTA